MQPVLNQLPIRPSEAAALAEVTFRALDGHAPDDDVRQRLAGECVSLGLESIRPYFASLEEDRSQVSAYYLAADGLAPGQTQPVLLRLAPATAPEPAGFRQPLLIGRVRPGGGREIAVHAIAFSSRDWESIDAYVAQTGGAFLPRPQGSLPAIATGNRHPEISLPAAFDAFRRIYQATGVNMASTVQLSGTREMTTDDVIAARDGEIPTAVGHTRVSIRHLYHAGLWAAVRAGWREGYTAEADHIIITGAGGAELARSLETGKEAIRHAAGFTKFTTDTSRMFELEADTRHPRAWTDAEVEARFEQALPAEIRAWVLDEFARPFETSERTYRLSRMEIIRLAAKFGRSLLLNEELYDYIRVVRQGRAFDFEPSIDEAETLTTPEEMIFFMHWLKCRARPAQLVPPNLGFKKRQAYPESIATTEAQGVGLADYAAHKMWPELVGRVQRDYQGLPLAELGARVRELAAVARLFEGTLSIHSGSGKQAAVLNEIGRATGGRVNYKISGELQLQLLDVLSEQEPGSPWRALYDRMVERCEEFAARGAFGEESELAAYYRGLGRGSYLGTAARGRVDGNLFLVFWIGNLVGTRDLHAPGGDKRFFKEKLDELPEALLAEVRRRNSDYIVWLAENLR